MSQSLTNSAISSEEAINDEPIADILSEKDSA